MTTIEEEPVLFGAKPANIGTLNLWIQEHESDRTSVRLAGHITNKRDWPSLLVYVGDGQSVSAVTGAMIPLIQRFGHISGTLFRRQLWALHDRLGREGYEVHIEGCGRQK